jgi:sialic acid synthase
MRGSDHKGSLGIDGLNRMVRDIRNLEMAFGTEDIFQSESTSTAKIKLERSIATKRLLKKGDIISEDDLHMLSPGDGFKWSDKSKIIGKRVNKDIDQNEIIYNKDIEDEK